MCATDAGVDMVSITQMASMLEASGQTYRDLCWSPAEQAYCGDSPARYATRWAAKEAVMKALGHGIGEVDPLDIEVLAHEGQRPQLRLSGTADAFAQQAGVSLSLSISHEGDLATAFVIATWCCANHASETL
ncbi:holo-ACP synthase [Nocardioides sp. GXZ039]|uniref:holo-ACP synthase n=1 Tax=Nocardioides sp. GXZ039 TaxID=3136018 RepID=UPI0030F3A873